MRRDCQPPKRTASQGLRDCLIHHDPGGGHWIGVQKPGAANWFTRTAVPVHQPTSNHGKPPGLTWNGNVRDQLNDALPRRHEPRHLQTPRLHRPPGSPGAQTPCQPDPLPWSIRAHQLTAIARHTGQAGQGVSRAPGRIRRSRHQPNPRAALTWAQGLRRVLGIDIETCRICGGAVRIIAFIEDPAVIEKILTDLNANAAEPEAQGDRHVGHAPARSVQRTGVSNDSLNRAARRQRRGNAGDWPHCRRVETSAPATPLPKWNLVPER